MKLKRRYKLKLKFKILLLVLFIIVGVLIYLSLFSVKIKTVTEVSKEGNEVTLKVELKNYLFNKVYCAISDSEETPENWIKAEKGNCILTTNFENNHIFIKVNGKVKSSLHKINEVLNLSVDKETIYIAVSDKSKINVNLTSIGKADETLTWKSEDESIATVENGEVTGLKAGTTKVSVTTKNDIKATVEVTVTDLIVKSAINSNKLYLPCERYSKEEADLLDKVLEQRIKDAGYETRSGPVAAARFLLLEFPYQIRYFNENGRLNPHSGMSYVDGEGRYYKKGLYLHESKFEGIIASRFGPVIWGCQLWDVLLGGYRPNGFTCSGFVTWTLINGGFDVGDSGAGDYSFRDDDLSDLGQKEPITKELMESGKVKVGDLIGREGHMAIIVGMDETNIYIAESLPINVRLVTLTKLDGLLKSTNFDFVLLMDEVYNNKQGNYTEMW